MSEVTVRQVERSDKDGLAAVYGSRGFFEFAPSRPDGEIIAATISSYLDDLDSDPAAIVFLVAALGTKVTGFSIARRTARTNWEVQVGVHSNYRQRGIGTSLLTKLFGEMRGRGSGECEAIIHSENQASIRMVKPFFQTHEDLGGMPGFVKFKSIW